MKLKGFKNLMRSGLFCKKRRNLNGSRFVHLIVTVMKIIFAELTSMKMMTVVRLGAKVTYVFQKPKTGTVVGTNGITK